MRDNAQLLTITIEHTRRTIEILNKREADICSIAIAQTTHKKPFNCQETSQALTSPCHHLFKRYADALLLRLSPKNLKLNGRIGLLLSAPHVLQQSVLLAADTPFISFIRGCLVNGDGEQR